MLFWEKINGHGNYQLKIPNAWFMHYEALDIKDSTWDALVILTKQNLQSFQSLLLCCWFAFFTIDSEDVISGVLLTVVCILDYCK